MPPTLTGSVYRAVDLPPDQSRLVVHVDDATFVIDIPPTANPIESLRDDPAGLLVTTKNPHGLFAADGSRFVPVRAPDLALTPGVSVTSGLVYRTDRAFVISKESQARQRLRDIKEPARVSSSVTSSVHNLVSTIAARLPSCLTFANSSDGSVRLTAGHGKTVRVQPTGLAQFLRFHPSRDSPKTVLGELPMLRFQTPLASEGVAATVAAQLSPTRTGGTTLLARVLSKTGSHDLVLPPGAYDGETVACVCNAQLQKQGITARLVEDGALLLSGETPFTVIGGSDAFAAPSAISIGKWFEAHGCHDVYLRLRRCQKGPETALPARAFPISALRSEAIEQPGATLSTTSEIVEFQGMTVCAEASVFHAPAAPSGQWRSFGSLDERRCPQDIIDGDNRSFVRVDAQPLNFLHLSLRGVPVSFTQRADAALGLVTTFEAVTKKDQRFKY